MSGVVASVVGAAVGQPLGESGQAGGVPAQVGALGMGVDHGKQLGDRSVEACCPAARVLSELSAPTPPH